MQGGTPPDAGALQDLTDLDKNKTTHHMHITSSGRQGHKKRQNHFHMFRFLSVSLRMARSRPLFEGNGGVRRRRSSAQVDDGQLLRALETRVHPPACLRDRLSGVDERRSGRCLE